jgi:glycosyltransferase involved in cell wall biosynthesis
MDSRKISLCIPNFKRPDLILETLAYPLTDFRIDEVIIVDDCSPMEDWHKLVENTKHMPKVKLIRNVKNFYIQINKRNSISFAKNSYVFVIDNDNVLDKDTIDKIFAIETWEPGTIYQPAFLAPNFDFREFNGMTITKENVHEFCEKQIFLTLCNANNFFCNRDAYLRSFEYKPDCKGEDSIFNFYNWLKNGNKVYVVPDMQYFHRVHETSVFLSEVDENMRKVFEWFDRLKQLK